MYQANTDYESPTKSHLSFRSGEQFLEHKSGVKGDDGWVHVMNENFQVGFVQERFLTKLNQSPENVKNFITNLMAKLHTRIDQEQEFQKKKQLENIMQILRQQRNGISSDKEKFEESKSSSPATQLPEAQPIKESFLKLVFSNLKRKRHLYELATNRNLEKIAKIQRKERSLVLDFTIPDDLGYKLLDAIRDDTGLTHLQAKRSVCKMLQLLQYGIPHLQTLWEELMQQIKHTKPSQQTLMGSKDWNSIKEMFASIGSFKSNSEELNWAVKQDETIILQMLLEFRSILRRADEYAVKELLQLHNYMDVSALIDYYEMETRPAVRIAILEIIEIICQFDRRALSVCVNSNLPAALARDMQNHEHDVLKFAFIGGVLLLLLSVGEPLPQTHFETINVGFVNFLLNVTDHPPLDVDPNEVIELCTLVLLALNLQFSPKARTEGNIILYTIMKRQAASVFVRQLINLLNLFEDPIMRVSNHEPKPANTVIQMLLDLVKNATTAKSISTNDLKILIEIISRRLTDSLPGDSQRQKLLRMIFYIIANTEYSSHRTRHEELKLCFAKILQENDDNEENEAGQEKQKEISEDQQIITTICYEFPDLFSYDELLDLHTLHNTTD